jgi:hypothetical protein
VSFKHFYSLIISITAEAVFIIWLLSCKWKEKKEVTTMEGTMIVALVLAIPVILFPAAFVWYLNIGGIVKAVREARAARTRKAAAKAAI